jgi:hypothetical protein
MEVAEKTSWHMTKKANIFGFVYKEKQPIDQFRHMLTVLLNIYFKGEEGNKLYIYFYISPTWALPPSKYCLALWT